MIDKENGRFYLQCSECLDVKFEELDTWRDAFNKSKYHRFIYYKEDEIGDKEQNKKDLHKHLCPTCSKEKKWIKDTIVGELGEDEENYRDSGLYNFFRKRINIEEMELIKLSIEKIVRHIYKIKIEDFDRNNYSMMYESGCFSAEIVEKNIATTAKERANTERIMVYTIIGDDRKLLDDFRLKMTYERLNFNDKIVLIVNNDKLYKLFIAQGGLMNVQNDLLIAKTIENEGGFYKTNLSTVNKAIREEIELDEENGYAIFNFYTRIEKKKKDEEQGEEE